MLVNDEGRRIDEQWFCVFLHEADLPRDLGGISFFFNGRLIEYLNVQERSSFW